MVYDIYINKDVITKRTNRLGITQIKMRLEDEDHHIINFATIFPITKTTKGLCSPPPHLLWASKILFAACKLTYYIPPQF